MSVFGGDRQNWISPIFAFCTREGPPAVFTTFWVITSPSISSQSSMVPPSLLATLISLRSTLSCLALSVTSLRTASTARGASISEFWATTLELRDVTALCTNESRSSRSTGLDISVRISSDFSAALKKPWVIFCGCSPFSRSFSAAVSRAPASTTTEVVPSPASISWDLDSSTNIFAVGWLTDICFRMVAPSLVMMTPPFPSWIILSMPRGPREVRTAVATAFAATMFIFRMSSPLPSLNPSC
mmetsp:Transcript_16168/g.39095  ORF Transcript_16168/g.39095 Transcript_16168/m.39095 type:complete len:243 (+) Transcript_16168:1121-1849(+)